MPSDHPVNEPLLTNLLVRRLVAEAKDKPPLEHAFDTLLRHSDAGACARKIGLKVAGHEASEPMDAPGLWVTFLGSLIHEALQEVIAEVFPDSVIEAKVRWDDLSASGHLDALVHTPEGRTVCYELKTMGGFGFDKSVGLNRKGYKLADKGPEGPRASAKIQGALNALAAGADELRIGHISLESVSKQLAEKINWGDEQRILAEWAYPRSVFEAWALTEKKRMAKILADVEAGHLPERWAIDDTMLPLKLNPEDPKQPWQCAYCSHLDLCVKAGPGEPRLPL